MGYWSSRGSRGSKEAQPPGSAAGEALGIHDGMGHVQGVMG